MQAATLLETPLSDRGLRWSALRARYRAQQASLAVASGLALQVFYRFFAPGRPWRPAEAPVESMVRRFRELLEADLAHVEQGDYPAALLTQIPLLEYLRRAPEGLLDAPRLVSRRRRRAHDELPKIDASRFPRYYLRNFHWQTDGWLSDRSARLYDLSVEVLFGGTADVMRRMAIPPVVRALRDHPQPRVLDVACGTGRFLLQLAQALPQAKLFGVDLSPFYVKEARRVLAGVDDVSLVVDNAEALPFADGAFEAVTSVFLFHELPRAARRKVVAEMRRVLAPGGVLSICDSAQLAESADLAFYLEDFANVYHEPYYREYLRDDLAEILREAGFEAVRVEPRMVSKVVVARAPR